MRKITKKQQEAYDKVTKYLEKNPGTFLQTACKRTGVVLSTYYRSKLSIKKRSLLPKKAPKINLQKQVKVESIVIPPVSPEPDDKVIVIVAPISQISTLIKNLGGNDE